MTTEGITGSLMFGSRGCNMQLHHQMSLKSRYTLSSGGWSGCCTVLGQVASEDAVHEENTQHLRHGREEGRGMLKYIRNQVMSLSLASLSPLIKAAPILTNNMYGGIQLAT